jgi:uncharacterized Zn-finger protein
MDGIKHEPGSNKDTTTSSDFENEHLLPITTLTIKSETKDESWDNVMNNERLKEEVTIEKHEVHTDNGDQLTLPKRRCDSVETSSNQYDMCIFFQQQYHTETGSIGENINQNSEALRKEKRYKCELCNKVFSQSSALTTHRRTHTGERPYACDICNRKFTQKVTLENHCRVHTGEKPFVCNICNSRFSKKTNLKYH